MKPLRSFALALFLTSSHAYAQNPSQAELIFWETVRDSKNPAELRAYLERFPNGMFAPIAQSRLAALERAAPAQSAPRPAAPAASPARPAVPAPAVASTAPASVTAETRMPQAGDTWSYTLSYPRLRGQWGQPSKRPSNYVVKVGGVNEGRISDQISLDGGSVTEVTHSTEPTLGPQGMSLFSPYLIALRDLSSRGYLGSVSILDPACRGSYTCEASARAAGRETVEVPAGKFNAVKVVVTQTWRSSGSQSGGAAVAGMMGGRTLTAWYVPELKRAVRFQSRLTVGDNPAVESNFDLDLVSYQVK